MASPSLQLISSYTRKPVSVAFDNGADRVVGNGLHNPVIVKGTGILREHARLFVQQGVAHIEPIEGSTVAINGQAINDPSPLSDGDWLALGSTLFQVRYEGGTSRPGSISQPITSTAPVPATPAQRTRRTGEITIGRLDSCDLAINSPMVSREHARLTWAQTGWFLEDLNSINGTFVNGKRVTDRIALRGGDRIAVASFAFLFTGEEILPVDMAGRVRIEVRGLYKEVKDNKTGKPRRLLDGIDFVIEPGEFVVIFGTSGSGKSTLLDALNGRRPCTGGQVLYNNADLYRAFDQFRATIGYVPQQDIVHRMISVRAALEYTARLRLPPDTSKAEIDEYITRVLDKVALTEKADSPINTPSPLSGGQLKRVSLAVELVANPNVLFLDEVTSGLDAGTDKRMMRLFAELAADQKTVVCVTHTLENIDNCNLVALMHRGRLVYYGPPEEVTGHFGLKRVSDVYEALESHPVEFWVNKFLQSGLYQQYVVQRMSDTSTPTRRLGSTASAETRRRGPWFDLQQAFTLMRRYCHLMVADKRNLAILLLQAPLIAAVVGLVFEVKGTPAAQAAAESQVSFILVLSAIWFGCLNSAREFVKELPIYLRERAVNLGIGPYLFSKLLPLAVLCALQCLLLLAVTATMIKLSGSFGGRWLSLFLAGMAATGMGLAVSAVVDTNDKAVALVPILLIPQVILSNAIVPLVASARAVAKASMISFWGFDAMKAALSPESLAAKDPLGQAVISVIGRYWSDLGLVVILGSVFLLAALAGLKLHDRKS
jgi:ABC-type multidrug transport system ATPase subunit